MRIGLAPPTCIPVSRIDIVAESLFLAPSQIRFLSLKARIVPILLERHRTTATRMAYTICLSLPLRFDPVPTTQSPTSATLRIFGLQVASVQTPKKGFGAKP